MKASWSALSVEYCKARKLKVLDLPELCKINSKNDLSLKCLEEQNKNLAVMLDNLRLKEAEARKCVEDLRECRERSVKLASYFKSRLIYIMEIMNSLAKSEVEKSIQDNGIENKILRYKDEVKSIMDLEDNEEACNKLDQTVLDVMSEFLRLGLLFSSHRTNGSEDDCKQNNGDHSIQTPALIARFEKLINNKMLESEGRIEHLEQALSNLKSEYNSAKKQLDDTLNYMDILRHKIYMMHDRYEEKMATFEKMEMERGEREKAAVAVLCEQQLKISNEKSSNATISGCETESHHKQELEEMRAELERIRGENTELANRFETIMCEHEKLKVYHKLISETPIQSQPEFKALVLKSETLDKRNSNLLEYLEFFWETLKEIRGAIRTSISSLQGHISLTVESLIEHVRELETERDALRLKSQADSVEWDRKFENFKYAEQNVVEYRTIVDSLKNQNEAYIAQLETLRTKLSEETKESMSDVAFSSAFSKEEAIAALGRQASVVGKLKTEQDAILTQMEITAQSYEDTYEQNLNLLQKIKVLQETNLKISSELFKSNQSGLSAQNQIATLEKLNKHHEEQLANSSQLTDYIAELEALKTSLEHQMHSNLMTTNSESSDLKDVQQQLDVMTAHQQNTQRNFDQLMGEYGSLKISLSKSQETITKLNVNISELKNQIEQKNKIIERNNKKSSISSTMSDDAILNEQLRIYKSKLTCPCCNSNSMNAILSKCFHLFCYQCLQMRYDTRQRKCPRCNTPFGHNDFHKVYF